MPDIDQLFKGMKDAPMFGRGNYITADGTFDVEIKDVQVKPRFKGGNVFICEFCIEASSTDKVKIGATCSWAPKLELPNTFGDIKSLILAAIGIDPRAVRADDAALHEQATLLARAACGSESAIAELAKQNIGQGFLKGRKVRLETMQTTTKAGGPFTRHTWSPKG